MGVACAAEGGLLAEQQRRLMAALRKEIYQFRAEPAGGEVCEAPDSIQGLVGRPGRDNAVHPVSQGRLAWEILDRAATEAWDLQGRRTTSCHSGCKASTRRRPCQNTDA